MARLATVAVIAIAAAGVLTAQSGVRRGAAYPGARVLLDAHNAYPSNGRFADRLERALQTGIPLAIEQDVVWRPAEGERPARSVVSHGEPFDGSEPSLREYFFERIRPIVEQALRDGATAQWPLITLNLDLKTNEPEHHRALWDLLGEDPGLADHPQRTARDASVAALDVRPVLVLTGESEAQAQSFHDAVPVGGRLRLFGAMPVRPPVMKDALPDAAAEKFWRELPHI